MKDKSKITKQSLSFLFPCSFLVPRSFPFAWFLCLSVCLRVLWEGPLRVRFEVSTLFVEWTL